MVYNISFEIVALVVLLFIVGRQAISSSFPDRKNQHFIRYMQIVSSAVFLNLLGCILVPYSLVIPLWISYTINTLVYFTQYLTIIALVSYILLLTGLSDKKGSILRVVFITISAFALILILSNPFTYSMFYFGEDGSFNHGYLYPVYCVLYAINLIATSVIAIVRRKSFEHFDYWIFILFSIIGGLCQIIQALIPHLILTGTGCAIISLILFLNLNNPSDAKHTLTESFSREKFVDYMRDSIHRGNKPALLYIDISGMTTINKSFGEYQGNELLRRTSKICRTADSHNVIFKYTGDTFLVVVNRTHKYHKIKQIIQEKLSQPFMVDNIPVYVNYRLASFNLLSKISPFHQLNLTLSLAIEKVKTMPANTKFFEISESFITASIATQTTREALRRALDNDGFEINIQPIINPKTNQIVAGEALCRLNDPIIGRISPLQFIPVAESSGLINQLTLQVFTKLCKFINKNSIIERSNIEWISINLSVADCLNPDQMQHIIRIAKANKIDPSKILIEITESMATTRDNLAANINILTSYGFKLGIDDFGTEFANIDSLSRLPFNIAKIDKSLIDIKDESYREIILKNTAQMFMRLGIEPLAEGVDTWKIVQQAKELGIKYIQGYIFSPPLEEQVFIEYLENYKGPRDEV